MQRFNYLLFVSLATLVSNALSAKILGVFLYPSRNHEVLGSALLTELANRGHEVTMISTFEQNFMTKNFKHIHVDASQIRQQYSKYLMYLNVSVWEHIKFSNSEMKYMIAELLEDAKLLEFLNSEPKYDVAVSVLFSEALLGISHRVNATTISFNPIGGNNALDYLSGNPHPYSYVPNAFTDYTDKMGYWQRFANTYANLFYTFSKHFFNMPMQKSLLKFYFPEAPPMEELIDNIDLHLVNSHHIFETPRPYLPNIIQIGGFHLQKPERLTVELLNYLNELKNGIVLFSLGSHKKFSDFSVKTIELLFACFAKSAHNVIVQYEGPQLSKVPKNVRLMSWLPQRAVLSHPNTKLFITHGGRSGIAEAIYFGVPMIGLTVSGDDNANIVAMVNRGFGVRFNLDEDLSEEMLSAGMREVVTNPAYKKAIMFESEHYKDQEMNPLDKAVYWIEHVAKYKGAKHLKSTAAATIPLYQYILLDVVFVSLTLVVIFCLIIFFISKYTYRTLIKRKRNENVKHKTV